MVALPAGSHAALGEIKCINPNLVILLYVLLKKLWALEMKLFGDKS